MSSLFRLVTPLFAACVLSGCASLQAPFIKPPFEDTTPVATPTPAEPVEIVGEGAAPVDPAAPVEGAAASTGALGETIASLGDPTQPGFWLKTPLVQVQRPGRIEGAGGAVVQVTLIPLGGEAGAGSEISLSAMRALNLSLTDLAPLQVYAR
ncbi:MAG: D-galactarate dehydratase [Pseudomonadota bacterium]